MRGELQKTANEMVAPGKGSPPPTRQRNDQEAIRQHRRESTEDNRRAYREMLFTSKDLGDHIGVILFDETIRQSAADGTFVDVLRRRG
jgi:fructose-bisphosphate aldolase class I